MRQKHTRHYLKRKAISPWDLQQFWCASGNWARWRPNGDVWKYGGRGGAEAQATQLIRTANRDGRVRWVGLETQMESRQ